MRRLCPSCGLHSAVRISILPPRFLLSLVTNPQPPSPLPALPRRPRLPPTRFARALTPVRFLGLTENKQEQERDFEELSALAKAGKPIYGESDLSPYLQGVAARNSTYSQFKLQTMPW